MTQLNNAAATLATTINAEAPDLAACLRDAGAFEAHPAAPRVARYRLPGSVPPARLRLAQRRGPVRLDPRDPTMGRLTPYGREVARALAA